MYKLVLLNHGECEWDSDNIFVGWTDVGLTEKGIKSAKKAGDILTENGYYLEYAFVSMLKRSLQTLWYSLEKSDQLWIPWEKSWKLNERHWGALQGLKEAEVNQEYGEKQVKQWMNSYQIKPPQVDIQDKRFPANNHMYVGIPVDELPHGESMEEVKLRVVQYWLDMISPVIKSKKKIIIVSHEYSMKALIKYLEKISDDQVSTISVEAGKPLIYELDSNLFHLNHYYLE